MSAGGRGRTCATPPAPTVPETSTPRSYLTAHPTRHLEASSSLLLLSKPGLTVGGKEPEGERGRGVREGRGVGGRGLREAGRLK